MAKNIRNVAANKMSNENLFQKVKRLKLPAGEYALFGSAPMGIRGMRNCHDVDIIVTKKLWERYSKKKDWELIKSSDKNKYSDGLRNDSIELWKDWWLDYDVSELIKEAEIIDDLPFVGLEKVLEWKKFIARDKDMGDVKIIEEFLKEKK